MPKRIPPLTDRQVLQAKPKDKEYKMADGGGLYLAVTPTGGKLWRIKYRHDGKEKKLHVGSYPIVSLADAREARDALKRQLHHGIDPSDAKKAQQTAAEGLTANSFEVVAREWHNNQKAAWSESHTKVTLDRLEKNVFPWLGARQIDSIKAPEVLEVLRRIESRGAVETARRMRIVCGQVFRYAAATGRVDADPTSLLKGALKAPITTHLAAITAPKDVGPLLRTLDGYKGSFIVKCALQLAPLWFVRPGELRKAEWAEIDFETAQWNVPAEKMKLGEPHIVPLSRQSVEILRSLQPLTGNGRYVFPSHRTELRPLSDNAVLSAMRRMGIEKEEMCGHGFRAMARTILDEVHGVRVDYIEHQLAHKVRDPNGRAYNRTSFLPERRVMMQRWADYLDELKQVQRLQPSQSRKTT